MNFKKGTINEKTNNKMTSPSPLSIFEPICSYCWDRKPLSNRRILFKVGKDFHWACSMKHLRELTEGKKYKIIWRIFIK